jgi:hypothetical protein
MVLQLILSTWPNFTRVKFSVEDRAGAELLRVYTGSGTALRRSVMLLKDCDHRSKSSTTSTWQFRTSPPSAGSSTPSSSRTRPGCCCVSAAAAAGQADQPRAAQARPDPDLSRLTAGEVIEPTAFTALDGSVVAVSGPGQVRLQFRWFAGCPICSQHLDTFAARHGDVAAAVSTPNRR